MNAVDDEDFAILPGQMLDSRGGEAHTSRCAGAMKELRVDVGAEQHVRAVLKVSGDITGQQFR